jgi:hypothetical protein
VPPPFSPFSDRRRHRYVLARALPSPAAAPFPPPEVPPERIYAIANIGITIPHPLPEPNRGGGCGGGGGPPSPRLQAASSETGGHAPPIVADAIKPAGTYNHIGSGHLRRSNTDTVRSWWRCRSSPRYRTC